MGSVQLAYIFVAEALGKGDEALEVATVGFEGTW
jgi:hypothetical protein